ncbi:MAG: transcription antitermination factor NusB [Mongoliibacter sp.]|uniref:transcription antitermination factor NusB n=1 Tax=Mongoliibacter sp. TaxID=2022438 RepID=UPI0012EFA4BC|nr:transcription antitermination factor NusB [Mongoliibacter sp.]TVP50951.1 MAG: transcription antitermination factor NusB [Mongoliibacter sp.]
MLNRRILRVKAFQNLYAYEQCKASNLNLAKDQIKEAFQPDLNSMEVQDKPLLKKEAALAIDLFSKNLRNEIFESGEFDNAKIEVEAKKALNAFKQANRKDFDFLANNMVTSAERLPQLYLFSIQILLGFSEHVEAESKRKMKMSKDSLVLNKSELNLSRNKILLKIKESEIYQSALIRHSAYIDDLELEIKEWFRDYVKPLESYQEYIKKVSPDLEDDYAIVDDILKQVIFKVDAILNFFAEKDLNWTENKAVIRSLASKVLKNVKENFDSEDEPLPEIALNWEDDKEFFQNIFNLTIQNDDQNKDLIAKRTQNWDIERIAQTDKIILSMAITEMQNFPSIPVKVSINEYIDISKTYSTPKSKQFVNGLLDVLSKELTESGHIRKSGRGLLDNK